MNLPSSLSFVILFIGVIVVMIMTAPASGAALFVLPAIYALVTSFLLERVYRKYLPVEESSPDE
jgi:Flp pilus assembly protein protease CpaA